MKKGYVPLSVLLDVAEQLKRGSDEYVKKNAVTVDGKRYLLSSNGMPHIRLVDEVTA